MIQEIAQQVTNGGTVPDWIQAIGTVAGIVVAGGFVYRRLLQADRSAKVAGALALLQARAQIQMSYSDRFSRTWPRWHKARNAYLKEATPENKIEMEKAAEDFCPVLWGQFVYLCEGLFDPHRLHMYSRYRVHEFAELDPVEEKDEIVRQTLLNISAGLGHDAFTTYMQMLSEAGKAYRKIPKVGGRRPPVGQCRAIEDMVELIMQEAADHRSTIYAEDRHDLVKLSEMILTRVRTSKSTKSRRRSGTDNRKTDLLKGTVAYNQEWQFTPLWPLKFEYGKCEHDRKQERVS